MATLKVKSTFFAHGRCFAKGASVESTDSIVAGREHLFDGVEQATSSPQVEQATAAPGEKRSVKRPARKQAAKSKE